MGFGLGLASCKKGYPPARDKFLGDWEVEEGCLSGNYEYEIEICRGNQDDEIVIENFGDFDVDLEATVQGNTFEGESNEGIARIEAEGRINGNNLEIEYKLYESNQLVDNCTMECIRQ